MLSLSQFLPALGDNASWILGHLGRRRLKTLTGFWSTPSHPARRIRQKADPLWTGSDHGLHLAEKVRPGDEDSERLRQNSIRVPYQSPVLFVETAQAGLARTRLVNPITSLNCDGGGANLMDLAFLNYRLDRRSKARQIPGLVPVCLLLPHPNDANTPPWRCQAQRASLERLHRLRRSAS